jgi:hypothetical protein
MNTNTYELSEKLKSSYEELKKQFIEELHKEGKKFLKSRSKITELIFYWGHYNSRMIVSDLLVSKGEIKDINTCDAPPELTKNEESECQEFHNFISDCDEFFYRFYSFEDTTFRITKEKIEITPS